MSNLESRVRDAGLDLEFIQQVNKLEELKQLVAQGRMREEVYKKLEDAVFRAKNEKTAAAAPKTKKKKFGIPGAKLFKNKTKSPIDKVKEADSSKGDMRSRTNSQNSKNASANTLSRNRRPTDTVVMEGELLKFVKKKNRREWKPVYVFLYSDRIEFKSSKDGKMYRAFHLTEDFVPSYVEAGVVKKAVRSGSDDDLSVGSQIDEEKRAESMTKDIQDCEQIINMSHVFVISSLEAKAKIFLACDSSQQRDYWMAMLAEVLKEVKRGNNPLEASAAPKKKLWQVIEERTTNFVQAKLGKKLKQTKGDMDEDELEVHMKKWRKQGKNVARLSVVQEWRSREMKKVKEIQKENEMLSTQLKETKKELQQVRIETKEELEKIEKENEQKLNLEKAKVVQLKTQYEDLMAKYRQEALERNTERKEEEARIKKRIKALKRRSVIPHSEEAQHFKEEYERMKVMLETLQKALNVDMDALQWDGTLEMAEEKMKECLQNILEGETPAIQQKAQQEFDQWDQLVRGHQDFISREENKWSSWEQENYEKNLEARNEMREKYVPEEFREGCSIQHIIDVKGLDKRDAAERVFKNKIFKFLWFEKDYIANLHAASLNNDYASQGLDIRELRAVYCCLPDQFQNDHDGKKKVFKENMRARLYQLTEKEKAGTLSTQEEMNNAYRDKAVRDKPKPDLPKLERQKPKAGNKFKKNAEMLGKLFQQQGIGSADGKKPEKTAKASNSNGTEAPKAAEKFDPSDEKWEKYRKMRKAGLPPPVIKRNLMTDGHDPDLWEQIESGGASKPKADAPLDPNSAEWKPYFRMKKVGLEEGAIRNKMAQDGKDPNLWDKLVAMTTAPSELKKETPQELNPDDPQWSEYFKMRQVGLADGAIMSKMQKDGVNPSIWDKLVEKKEKTAAKTVVAESLNPFNFSETIATPSMKEMEVPKTPAESVGPAAASDIQAGLMNLKVTNNKIKEENEAPAEEPKKKKKKKKRTEKQSEILDGLGEGDEQDELKQKLRHKKKSRRGTKKNKKSSSHHLLQGNTSDLVSRATAGMNFGNLEVHSKVKGNAALGGMMEYGDHGRRKSAKKGKRSTLRAGTEKLQNDSALQDIIDYILTEGEFDEVQGGVRSMKFGDVVQNFLDLGDVLVAILAKGKKAGSLKYAGDMLFSGIHDEVKITVL